MIGIHKVIRAIVYAKTKEEALNKAKEIFEKLCNEKIYDYYTTFDDDNSTISGKARWGNLPAVVSANSKKGKQLINEGMEATYKEFKHYLHKIKEVLLKFTTEQLFEAKLERYFFGCVSGYAGHTIWLYDQHGEGITNFGHLSNILNKWKNFYKKAQNPYRNQKIWVVPADVHY